MRCQGIRGASRSKKRFTTKSDPDHVRDPGIVYVAFVVDVFSRRLVGWKAARSMTTTLILDALNMAAWSRRHMRNQTNEPPANPGRLKRPRNVEQHARTWSSAHTVRADDFVVSAPRDGLDHLAT